MPRPTRSLTRRVNVDGEARWHVRMMVQGKRVRFGPPGGFPSQAEARRFRDDAKARLRLGTFFPEQFKATALPLARLLERETAPETQADRKNVRAYRAFWLERAGHLDAKQLPASLIDDARRALAARRLSPQTIHHYLKYLRHRLNRARRDGLLDTSPFDRAPLAAVHNLRVRAYAPHERRKIFQKLATHGEEWRDAAELAGLTGLRWTEQFTLEKRNVDLRQGLIHLSSTKAGRPQIRLLSHRARELLARQIARHRTSRWLYPNQTNTGPIDYANFRKRIWLPACQAAGATNARWNDWRHTFASDLTMAGHSDRTVAHLLGHTSTQMVARYAHLSEPHLRQAVEQMANKWPTARQSKTLTTR